MKIQLGKSPIEIGSGHPLFLIAGPCVIEDLDRCLEIAGTLKEIARECGISYVFKASFDKANRSSITSYRGPGLEKGLEILAEVKRQLDVPVISDIHVPEQAEPAARVLDILQIPAFLCRQTDLLLAAARTGAVLNIKKGQFLAPWEMKNVVDKVKSMGNDRILLTDRGNSFGYNNLVVDFRSVPILKETGCPMIFDATHSVQIPGGAGTASGGNREYAPVLARSAVAAGADGIFIEVHPDPDNALCDGPNSIYLSDVPKLVKQLVAIKNIVDEKG